MAKPKSTQRLSGQAGGQVYTDGKYGPAVRGLLKVGVAKPDSRSREQNARTSYLNELAGDLNMIIKKYAGTL